MTVTARLSNTTADKRKKVFSSLVHDKCTSIGPCLQRTNVLVNEKILSIAGRIAMCSLCPFYTILYVNT